jgi:S-adenosylmethionine:tRNA ribosyltransferase-isomerase
LGGGGVIDIAGANTLERKRSPALAVQGAPPPGGCARAQNHNRAVPARRPPEWRGIERDGVRLMVSDDDGHRHARFADLATFLLPGDLLIVNESGTLAASLPARGRLGEFRLNLSTRYASDLWLAEPRPSAEQPGPMPWRTGDRILAAGVPGRWIAPYATAPRLWFVVFDGNIDAAMARSGEPIRYGYLQTPAPPLSMYQTMFARVLGSAEMPSAARPFTQRVMERLARRGVGVARVVLHTGVSSLDLQDGTTTSTTYPEPFRVPAAAAEAVNRARREGGRVIAVGTTVVRALESAARDGVVRGTAGFTRLMIGPRRDTSVVDGLITGLHEPGTSHLDLLTSIGGEERVKASYEEATREEYLWHEFGDAHLLWAPGRARQRERGARTTHAA